MQLAPGWRTDATGDIIGPDGKRYYQTVSQQAGGFGGTAYERGMPGQSEDIVVDLNKRMFPSAASTPDYSIPDLGRFRGSDGALQETTPEAQARSASPGLAELASKAALIGGIGAIGFGAAGMGPLGGLAGSAGNAAEFDAMAAAQGGAEAGAAGATGALRDVGIQGLTGNGVSQNMMVQAAQTGDWAQVYDVMLRSGMAPTYAASQLSQMAAEATASGAPGSLSTFGQAAGSAAGSAGGSLLSKFLGTDTGVSNSDLMKLLGTAGAAGLSTVGSLAQSKAFTDLANQYTGFGAPSRARYEGSFAPGFSMSSDPGYSDALAQASKANLYGLSKDFGNPSLSPNAQAQNTADLYAKTAYPALQSYRSGNAAAGGLSTAAAAAPQIATQAISAGNIYPALGGAVSNIFNPVAAQPNLTDLAKLFRGY